ncbi:hypothetical protein HK103_000441 [Boothiomyces macroporosus]|uniref:Uncharacterized protein n=1 Tax=Boothiomyces macroporosus TaxID=261099 RepID=A0AAD5UBZ5_9FUNG|nr:hypothetical protein HK103_000441 [Boothiomyces macroporosus]
MKCVITEAINSIISKEPKERSFAVYRRQSTIKFKSDPQSESFEYNPVESSELPRVAEEPQLSVAHAQKEANPPTLKQDFKPSIDRDFLPYTTNSYQRKATESIRQSYTPALYKPQPREYPEYTATPSTTHRPNNYDYIYTNSPFEPEYPITSDKCDTFKQPQYTQPPIIQQNVYKIHVYNNTPERQAPQEYPKPHFYDQSNSARPERLAHRLAQNDRPDWDRPKSAVDLPQNRYSHIAEQEIDDYEDYNDLPYIDDLYSEINVTLSLPRKNMQRFPTRKVFRNIY